ncbi:hypothetical protein COOONC_17118, partial [Cooperia oncophora]
GNSIPVGLLDRLLCKPLSQMHFVTILPSMLIERLVASYYIDDYETKSRAWVAAVALTSSFSLAVCYTTPMIFGEGSVGIDRMVLFSTSVSVVFAIVFVKLYRRDRRRLKETSS